MNVFLQYIVPVLSVPFLMLFKYGKPRGYLKDLLAWHAKPRIYCGMEPDSQVDRDYLTEEEFNAQDCRAASAFLASAGLLRAKFGRLGSFGALEIQLDECPSPIRFLREHGSTIATGGCPVQQNTSDLVRLRLPCEIGNRLRLSSKS